MTYIDFISGKKFRFKGSHYHYDSECSVPGIYKQVDGKWFFHCHVVSVGPTGVYVSSDIMGLKFSKCLTFEKFLIYP